MIFGHKAGKCAKHCAYTQIKPLHTIPVEALLRKESGFVLTLVVGAGFFQELESNLLHTKRQKLVVEYLVVSLFFTFLQAPTFE